MNKRIVHARLLISMAHVYKTVFLVVPLELDRTKMCTHKCSRFKNLTTIDAKISFASCDR